MIDLSNPPLSKRLAKGCLLGGILLLFVGTAYGQSSAPPTEDIRDIMIKKPPASLTPLFVTLAIIIIALAGAFFALKKLLKRDVKFTGPPPELVARQKLGSISNQIEDMPPNKASLETSEAVKDFLAAQYEDPIRFETAEEYLTRISRTTNEAGKVSLSPKLTEQVRSFMSISQELKFAQIKEARSRIPALLKQAETIIEMAVQGRRA